MVSANPVLERSEAAIFARVWEGTAGRMSFPIARHILKLRFSIDDKDRMHELLERNRAGTLSEQELEELDNFVKVADLLAILQSKSRKLLTGGRAARNRHGPW